MNSLLGNTQTFKDSVVIAVKDAKRVLQSAMLTKSLQNEVEGKNYQINTLLKLNDIKDSILIIKTFQTENYKKLSDLNESNFFIEKNKREILQKDFNNYQTTVNKEIRNIKRKGVGGRILTGLIGVVVGIITVTLTK